MNSVTTVRLLVAVVTKQLALLKLSLQGLPAHIPNRFANPIADSLAVGMMKLQRVYFATYAALAT
mgnify:CR=1 FL=1